MVNLANDIINLSIERGVPRENVLGFLVGMVVGILKASGATDEQVQAFMQKNLDESLNLVKTMQAKGEKP
jgi:hypothetical protein